MGTRSANFHLDHALSHLPPESVAAHHIRMAAAELSAKSTRGWLLLSLPAMDSSVRVVAPDGRASVIEGSSLVGDLLRDLIVLEELPRVNLRVAEVAEVLESLVRDKMDPDVPDAMQPDLIRRGLAMLTILRRTP